MMSICDEALIGKVEEKCHFNVGKTDRIQQITVGKTDVIIV